jgi:proteasome lid subunit RPN8/RPN11
MLDRMVEHARREAPNECVGVLGARDGEAQLLVEAENARRSPLAYEIAPQELLRVHDRLDEDDLEVGAIYHSHTRTEPVPSQTDINLAFYPESLYVIVGVKDRDAPEVKAYRIVDGEVSEATLEVV